MKRVSLGILIITLMIILCSCNGAQIDIPSDVETDTNDWVTIDIDQDTVTRTSAEVTITVNTDYEISGGEPEAFAVEMLKDGVWYKLKYKHPDDVSPAVAYGYSGTEKVTADWNRHYGKLPDGHYRLIKYLSATTDIDNETGETTEVDFCVSDEFDVGS